MIVVSRAESKLLQLVQALLGIRGEDSLPMLLNQAQQVAPPFSPAAIDLLKDYVSKGVVMAMARASGQPVEYRAQDSVARSYWWQQLPAPPLHFSRASMELLLWLLQQPLGHMCALLDGSAAGLGDELLLCFTAYCLLSLRNPRPWRSPMLMDNALCWLLFADQLAMHTDSVPDFTQDYIQWIERYPAIVSALQQSLRLRWLAMEKAKSQIQQCSQMIRLGRAQQQVLQQWLDAVRATQRADLAGFVFSSTARLLAPGPDSRFWIESLDDTGGLSEHQQACDAAGAVLQCLNNYHTLVEEARQCRFFDAEYDASQLLLRLWQPLGDDGLQRAQAIVKHLGALDVAVETIHREN